MRYWEDIHEGDVVDCGRHAVSLADIAAFGKQFDPQPFHVDEAGAARSVFGGVVASGFHTAALCNRLAFDCYLRDVASLGSTALDEVRWHQPVRPGDSLALHLRVVEKVPSRNKPDRGIVRFRYELHNARRETVLTMVVTEIVALRGEDMPPLPR
jgi:acyl dehydratase